MKLPKLNLRNVNLKNLWRGVCMFEANYRPQILSGLAVGGLWISMGLTYQAAPKIQRVIKEKKEDLSKIPPEDKNAMSVVKKELAIEVAKHAAAPVLMGAVSSAAMIGSTSVSTKRIAAITAAYSATEATLSSYRDKVKELMGEQKDRKIIDAIASDNLNAHPLTEDTPIYQTGNGETKFYDPWTGRYFYSSPEAVQRAFNELTYQCQMEDYVTQNDLYEKLNLPEAKGGEVFGWTIDNRKKGLIDIGFSAILDSQQRPVAVLEYEVEVLPYYRGVKRIGPHD